MTIAAEVDGDFTPVGICYRYSIDDGDTLYAIFSDTDLPRPRGNEGYNVFSPGGGLAVRTEHGGHLD